jgi:hypothetical protein
MAELITLHPILYGLLVALLAFIMTWAISFVVRLLNAPVQLFSQAKGRADSAEQKIKGHLEFVRRIRREGDGGRYSAYATVRNTSLATKLKAAENWLRQRSPTGDSESAAPSSRNKQQGGEFLRAPRFRGSPARSHEQMAGENIVGRYARLAMCITQGYC